MQNCHEGVEHFGAHIGVHVLVVLEAHVLGGAPSHIIVEHGLSKQLDVLLITDPVPVVHILALLVLIEALPVLGPHHLPRAREPRTASLHRRDRPQGRHALVGTAFDDVLDVLQLDVSFEGHVGHHDADVLGGDKSIAIEIIPRKNGVRSVSNLKR